MKSVILFLTSAISLDRTELSLSNLKQLSKLNKDIIILTTNSHIDKRFYSYAKCVIIDENKNTFSRNLYRKMDTYAQSAYTAKSVLSTEVINNCGLQIKLYLETNYLNVFKNTKNLIRYAIAQDYDNFLYVEDDHYFSDEGIKMLGNYFDELNHMNAIYFGNYWTHNVLRSHFWFGNCRYFEESIVDNFPECMDDIDNKYPYFALYELFLYNVMYEWVYNKDRVKIVSFDENPFEKQFGPDSKLNQVDYVKDILNDINTTIIYNEITQTPNLHINFRDTQLDNLIVNFRVYNDTKTLYDRTIDASQEKTILCPISIDGTIYIQLNELTKKFKVSLEDTILNGKIC